MGTMAEPKPFASLTSSLLARKGGARPAMRRAVTLCEAAQDDLGWNDMGDDDTGYQPTSAPLTGLTPMPSAPAAEIVSIHEAQPIAAPAAPPPVVEQRQQLAAQVEKAAPPARAAMADRGAKAAFTLRLDRERHLRLRLACAVNHRSAQQIVTEALDSYLNDQPEIEALAERVRRDLSKGKIRGTKE